MHVYIIHALAIKLAGNATFGSQFCPGSTAGFECQTIKGSLLWETSSTVANHIFDNPTQSSKLLGIFLLQLDGILLSNEKVLAVNSTAVVSNVQPSYNGTTLKCSEDADLSMFREAVLRVAGNIMAVSELYILAALLQQLPVFLFNSVLNQYIMWLACNTPHHQSVNIIVVVGRCYNNFEG